MSYLLICAGLGISFASYIAGKDPVFWVVLGLLIAGFGLRRLSKEKAENEFFSLPFVKSADYKFC